MFDLGTPLRALLVALAGVALTYLWLSDQMIVAVALAVAAVVLGWVINRIGELLLPKRPVASIRFLESWLLTPAAIAAVASAVVVVITVTLTIPDDSNVSGNVKELVGTLSTGLTAFLTAAFIEWAGDDKNSKLADHVKSVFQSKYGRKDDPNLPQGAHGFPAGSDPERWVFSDEFGGIEGWGYAARRKRAQGVADSLAMP